MEVLTHVNKRVKLQPIIKLPAAALAKQYADPHLSPIVLNFTIMYLEMAMNRYTMLMRHNHNNHYCLLYVFLSVRNVCSYYFIYHLLYTTLQLCILKWQ